MVVNALVRCLYGNIRVALIMRGVYTTLLEVYRAL